MNVVLAEDHKMVRQGTRMFLESAGVTVLGEATDGEEAVHMACELEPDVVIMDIHMPGLTGIEATRRIRHENESVRVLVLTAYDTPAYVRALLKAGADGYVLKTAEFTELLEALQDVAAGKTAFDPNVLKKAHHQSRSELYEDLTQREIEVLQQAAQGLTNKQIGHNLFISDRTVQGHLQNIYRKFGVTTRTEAVTAGLSHSLIHLEDER